MGLKKSVTLFRRVGACNLLFGLGVFGVTLVTVFRSYIFIFFEKVKIGFLWFFVSTWKKVLHLLHMGIFVIDSIG